MTTSTIGLIALTGLLAIIGLATQTSAQTEIAGSRCVYSELTPQAPPPPPTPEPPRFNHQRHELALASKGSCTRSQIPQSADLLLPVQQPR
jgi:hypothetical protein